MAFEINATKAGRNLSELLSRVHYQGASFDIKRGKEVVARLVAANPVEGLQLSQLNAFFAALPKLEKNELNSFEKDLKAIRAAVKAPRNVWA